MYISHRIRLLYIYLHLVGSHVNMKVNMAYMDSIGWYLFQNDIFLHQHEQIGTLALGLAFGSFFWALLLFSQSSRFSDDSEYFVLHQWHCQCPVHHWHGSLGIEQTKLFFWFSTCFQTWQKSGNVKMSDWQQLRFLLLPTLSAVNASMIVKDPTDRVYLKLLPLAWIIQEWMQNAISPAWLISLAQMERFHWKKTRASKVAVEQTHLFEQWWGMTVSHQSGNTSHTGVGKWIFRCVMIFTSRCEDDASLHLMGFSIRLKHM